MCVVSFVIKLSHSRHKRERLLAFNNSPLEDKAYRDIVNYFWTDCRIKQNEFSDLGA